MDFPHTRHFLATERTRYARRMRLAWVTTLISACLWLFLPPNIPTPLVILLAIGNILLFICLAIVYATISYLDGFLSALNILPSLTGDEKRRERKPSDPDDPDDPDDPERDASC